MTSRKRSRSEDARIDGLIDDVAQKRQKLVDTKREFKQAVQRRDADPGYQARMAEVPTCLGVHTQLTAGHSR